MRRLGELRNIGATLEKKLNAVGIFTPEELRAKRPEAIYAELCNLAGKRLPVCYYLYSLAGAVKDKDWRGLSEKEKRSLLRAASLP